MVAISFILPMVSPITWIASTVWPGRGLDFVDLRLDFVGGLRGLAGERLDLAGDHGEALAGVARARRLDRRVQRQQVGLAGDALDKLHHLADALRGLVEALDDRTGIGGLAHRLVGDLRRLMHLAPDFLTEADNSSAELATVCTLADACSTGRGHRRRLIRRLLRCARHRFRGCLHLGGLRRTECTMPFTPASNVSASCIIPAGVPLRRAPCAAVSSAQPFGSRSCCP